MAKAEANVAKVAGLKRSKSADVRVKSMSEKVTAPTHSLLRRFPRAPAHDHPLQCRPVPFYRQLHPNRIRGPLEFLPAARCALYTANGYDENVSEIAKMQAEGGDSS